MASHRRHSRRGKLPSLLVATFVLAALLAALATQVATAGEPPCPSCPDRLPPAAGPSAGSSGSGAGQPLPPLVSLGPVSVENGVASLTGVVNGAAGPAGSAVAGVRVTVDAAPVSVSVNGTFSASAKVKAGASIVVKASDGSTGRQYVISIPVSAIPAGGVAADALAQIDADAVTLMLPPDGFTIVDGVAISASVHVKAIAGIAALKLNGANVLAKLRIGGSASGSGSGSSSGSGGSGGTTPGTPGTTAPAAASNPPCHHAASATVAGSARTVRLTVQAANGASQTSTIRVKRVRSVVRLGRSFSISAFGARGIRITAVRFDTSATARTHRLTVGVTVRDRRNYLVRDAVVMLVPTAKRATIRGSVAALTDMSGRARFSVPVSRASLGLRLSMVVTARTPTAWARVTRSVQVAGAR